jgi:hypothetical protein
MSLLAAFPEQESSTFDRSAPIRAIQLVVKPHPGPDKTRVFVTELPDGSPIQSHQPFLTAARSLVEAGCDPKTPLEMRHDGSPYAALTSTVGAAAKLTVKADDRLHRYNAFSRLPVSPPECTLPLCANHRLDDPEWPRSRGPPTCQP